MTRVNRTDSGNYVTPAEIQAQSAYVDNGSGGNANAGVWDTIIGGNPAAPLMIHLFSGNFGRGLSRSFKFQQLYPEASHWAEMRWRPEANLIDVVDGTQTLLVFGRRYQILGARDPDLDHVKILMALVEYQAQGTRKIS